MKLSEYWKKFDEFSGKASDQCRQLAFAGIAVLWLFAIVKEEGIKFPGLLYLVLTLFVIALGLDLLQYFYASVAWNIFCQRKENGIKVTDDPEFDAPVWINYPTDIFFHLKIIFVLLGYLFLGVFLKGKILI